MKYELIDEENLEKKLIILEEENSILLNPYLIPPNIDIALMHQKANKFGFEPEESKIIDESIKINNDSHLELKINEDSIIKSTPISDYEEKKSNNLNFQECPCCFESLNKQKLNFFFDSNEIEILGPAYPIFLKMLKTLLFFIIIPYFFSVFIPHIIYLYFECGNVNSMSLCNSGDEDFNLDLYLQVIDDRLLVDLLFSIYFSIVVTIFRIKAIRFI